MATHTFSQSSPAHLKHYDVIGADNIARRAAVDGCNALLRAQLRAGMHTRSVTVVSLQLAALIGRQAFSRNVSTAAPTAVTVPRTAVRSLAIAVGAMSLAYLFAGRRANTPKSRIVKPAAASRLIRVRQTLRIIKI